MSLLNAYSREKSGSTTNLHNAVRSTLQTARGPVTYYRLAAREEAGLVKLDWLSARGTEENAQEDPRDAHD